MGALLHNVWQAAIGKERPTAAKDFTDFMALEAVKAGDPAGLLAGRSWHMYVL